MTPKRSGRKVALIGLHPAQEAAMPLFLPNHGLHMIAATLQASALDELELRVFDLATPQQIDLLSALGQMDPDVVGFSCYLWSLPFIAEIARILHQDDPSRLFVFGGPSARPSMFSLAPFTDLAAIADALVINEGEYTMLELVALRQRDPEHLQQIKGIAWHDGQHWQETAERDLGDLNDLASPYQMDISPHGGVGILQTYRGCPLTCSFCEWGTLGSPRRVREVENLEQELLGMHNHQVDGVLLVDAALNLNKHAFNNLHQAAKRTGFFAQRHLICEVHPARLTDQHLNFLAEVAAPMVGVGLQSFDPQVLNSVERQHNQQRFDDTLQQLVEVSSVALEIILGLPGDDPETFRRTFAKARSLPCALRVYHCVVLPSALMVRSPPHYQLDYDPITLKMRSCLGWTEQALRKECEFLSRASQQAGGAAGEFYWIFPPP